MNRPNISDNLIKRMSRIRLLLMDCDGVLTDGRLYFTDSGEAMKVFNVRDGQGIVNWHNSGFRSGIITGRGGSRIIQNRVDELGIHYFRAGSTDKARDVEEIVTEEKILADEIAYVGDDLGDLESMRYVGLPIAVSDAVDEIKRTAAYVTSKSGGDGAVREVVDLLLASKS